MDPPLTSGELTMASVCPWLVPPDPSPTFAT